MKRTLITMGSIFLILCSSFISSAFAQWSGSISADSQVDGSGWWGDTTFGDTIIEWNIVQNGSVLTYTYEFTHPEHDASYFILETSDNFGYADITTELTYEIGTYYDNGINYQGMPGTVYGIKFESFTSSVTNPDGTITDTIIFESPRIPTWGDIYARCGIQPDSEGGHGTWDAAWNVGFIYDDTNDGFHVMVPDTVVPEPISSVLFIAGGAALGFRSFRKKFQK